MAGGEEPAKDTTDLGYEELDEPDVEDSKKEIETETPAGFKVDNTVLETDDDLEELLEQADEETLEEVAKELEKEEPKIYEIFDDDVEDDPLNNLSGLINYIKFASTQKNKIR